MGNNRCKTEPEIRDVISKMVHSSHLNCQRNDSSTEYNSCDWKHIDFPATMLMTCKGTECSSIPDCNHDRPDYHCFYNMGCNPSTYYCDYGCDAGYFGNYCFQECPVHCYLRMEKGCNQKSGDCYGCIQGYTGNDCSEKCVYPHCICDQKDPNSCGTCIDSYFGEYNCDKKCEQNCKSCNKNTGDCEFQCKEGYWGENGNCQYSCSSNCDKLGCKSNDGSCINEKCKNGYYGRRCDVSPNTIVEEIGIFLVFGTSVFISFCFCFVIMCLFCLIFSLVVSCGCIQLLFSCKKMGSNSSSKSFYDGYENLDSERKDNNNIQE